MFFVLYSGFIDEGLKAIRTPRCDTPVISHFIVTCDLHGVYNKEYSIYLSIYLRPIGTAKQLVQYNIVLVPNPRQDKRNIRHQHLAGKIHS